MTQEASDTLLLRPRRLKWLLILAVSVAFTIAGGSMIRDGQAKGWFVISVFALSTLISIGLLLPGRAYLRITPEGFEMRSLFRSLQLRWTDVAGFRAGRIGLNKMVLFNYAASYTRSPKARALATALTGTEAALPDTYGYTADDLAALLNDRRARAVRTSAS
jgi:hypothetical protein